MTDRNKKDKHSGNNNKKSVSQKKKINSQGLLTDQAGKQAQLLYAFNAVSALLQRSAWSEADIFKAFSEQIVGLNLSGSIMLLEQKDEFLVVRSVAFPQKILKTLASLEKISGLKTVGFKFPVKHADVFWQVIKDQEALFFSTITTVLS